MMATDLGGWEEREPFRIDERPEAAQEGRRLFADLRVHPEVGHLVDVADPSRATPR